jgi:prevent-host-death family protein
MAGDDVRRRAFELRAKGCTYALIEKRLGIPYLRARELGTEYDARHGKPGRIVRTLADETSGLGSTIIPVRDLRNDTARILRQVEKGQTFVVTVSGHKVAELRPASDSAFVPRSVVESILREAPLDRRFAKDIEAAAGQRVDDL